MRSAAWLLSLSICAAGCSLRWQVASAVNEIHYREARYAEECVVVSGPANCGAVADALGNPPDSKAPAGTIEAIGSGAKGAAAEAEQARELGGAAPLQRKRLKAKLAELRRIQGVR